MKIEFKPWTENMMLMVADGQGGLVTENAAAHIRILEIAVQTIATAEPSVAPPPMVKHIIPRLPGGGLADEALCGYLWDRPLAGCVLADSTCEPCQVELVRRASGGA